MEPADSEQLVEVSYNTIRGRLHVTPEQSSDSSSSCFLIFDGLDLTEDGLKDWLRLCTKQVGSVGPIHGRSVQGHVFHSVSP